MRNKLLILLLNAAMLVSHAEDINKDDVIKDIYLNPYIDDFSIPSDMISSLEELYEVHGEPIEISTQYIENYYDADNPIERITLDYNEYFVIYSYNPLKNKYFKKLLGIKIVDGKMKYGINTSFKKEDIIDLLGEYAQYFEYEKNTVMLYVADMFGMEQVHFSFDLDGTLSYIYLLISV